MLPDAAVAPVPAVEQTPDPGDVRRAEIRAPRSDSFTFRRFIESSVLFLTAIILLRSIAIEPFGVPTGSMALTLAGNHKSCICPRCGYPIMIGSNAGPNNDQFASQRGYATACCPNCGQGNLGLETVPETVGDRLLVDKNIFEMRSPRRWEIGVFRCPSDPTKPYVKRVVGLPGEKIQVRDGDVYVDGQLCRKTLTEAPPCASSYSTTTFNRTTAAGSRAGVPARRTRRGPALLKEANDRLDGTELKWPAADASAGFRWLLYRHWLLEERREEPIRDTFAYNGGALRHELKNVHDFIVEMEVEVGAGAGTVAVGLRDGHDDVTVEIAAGPAQNLHLRDAAGKLLMEAGPCHFAAGRTHRVQYAFVDRRVSLSVDGNELIRAFDLPAVNDRAGVSRPVWLGVQGVAATIRHFRLDRDVHYAAAGRNALYEPWPLGHDEYFMLGDNSANSEDSRYWSIPGVPESAFMGKPLLLHQPSRWGSLRPGWDVQTVDWQRVRWVR